MRCISRNSFAVGVFAIGFSTFTHPVRAATPLPGLTNLNFVNYTGAAPKNTFTAVNPTGWTGGNGLIFIDQPGTSSSNTNTACGSTYLQTYGCPSALSITGGYNVVEADGNPQYESGFNYSVSGLTINQTYQLSFYQAASQQTTFNGATTEQWIVSLGTAGMQSSWNTVSNQCALCTYSNSDPNASIVATTLMSTPSHGLTDWQYVTISLKADATTDVLSFLAWGDNGSTVNLPPMVFLTGVNSAAGLNTPEPGSIVLFGSVLVGVGAIIRRRAANKV